jgi:uncharacterized protein (TIGR03066 family)
MRTLLGAALVLAMACGATAADDKIDAKKLVGTWEPKEAKKGEDMRMEFTRDGKLILSASASGSQLKAEGTYKLDGNKLSFKMKLGGETVEDTVTITKLTDDELEGKGSDGKLDAYKRVKGKGKEKEKKK